MNDPDVTEVMLTEPNTVLLVPVDALLPESKPIMVLLLTSVTFSRTRFVEPGAENDTV